MWILTCLVGLTGLQIPKFRDITFTEKLEIVLPGDQVETHFNTYWVTGSRIRTDRNRGSLTLILDLDLHLLYIIDHETKTYQITKTGLEKRDARLNLIGLANLRNGTLQKPGPLVEATGRSKKIGPWNCDEYRVRYPDNFGVETSIWSVDHRFVDRGFFKKLWYSALGTSPPGDAKVIFSRILREIRGIPIRIHSKTIFEDMEITTIATITSLKEFNGDETALMAIPSDYNLDRD